MYVFPFESYLSFKPHGLNSVWYITCNQSLHCQSLCKGIASTLKYKQATKDHQTWGKLSHGIQEIRNLTQEGDEENNRDDGRSKFQDNSSAAGLERNQRRWSKRTEDVSKEKVYLIGYLMYLTIQRETLQLRKWIWL